MTSYCTILTSAMTFVLTTSMVVATSVHHDGVFPVEDLDDIQVEEHLTNRCITKGGHCYSNEDCCHGYVCSAPQNEEDNHFAGGHCFRQSCHTSVECAAGSQCIDVDNTGQGQCGVVTSDNDDERQRKQEWTQHMYTWKKGGLGTACDGSSDCKDYTMDGQDKLCCQDVRRGRQGTKRMCDRVTRISVCIGS